MVVRPKAAAQDYSSVEATPVKAFFTEMLTRDISLHDAMLDLLDNCVDGILRSRGKADGKQPYEGYWAEINFSEDGFCIRDNCGGIPWELSDYAFRMGRPEDKRVSNLPMVGTYGIGLKRAVFKIGRRCAVWTQCGEHNYVVEITPGWLKNDTDWRIPVVAARQRMKEDGTEISVGELRDGIREQFGQDRMGFEEEFRKRVASHYAFIVAKGFRVSVNGHEVPGRPTKLVFADPKQGERTVRPFIYEADVEGVNVFLAVGLTMGIPSVEDVQNEQNEPTYSSLDAGWTVVCNDRAVLYCDRTQLTGWGDGDVPQYHTQFIAISGIVEFRSSDARKLPTTTTKRGIDASSPLFLRVKNKMREGMKLFTDYTNWWKKRTDEAKEHIRDRPTLTIEEIRKQAGRLSFHETKVGAGGNQKQYKPKLPKPKKADSGLAVIRFTKPVGEVRVVASYLFSEPEVKPSVVGERCFDEIRGEASK
jgi:hypothetical protein